MKLFQQLLLAPAALGLLAPIAAQAADVSSLSGVSAASAYSAQQDTSAASAYSAQQDTDAFRAWQSQNQVTSVAQFSDVQPTDWAYQALSNLVERYGCVAGYPEGTFKGKQALSRFEAAALLNACLDRVTEVTDELRRLQKEFGKELAVLKGRVSGLEAKVGKLEATQFSTTTKLKGETTWTLGGLGFGGNNDGTNTSTGAGSSNQNSVAAGGTTFNYDLRLALNTSFTGKDLLFTRLRAGNFVGSGFSGTPYNLSKLDIASPSSVSGTTASNNGLYIDRLYYRFPAGKEFTFVVGPIMRNTEALAIEPSYYGDIKLLNAFTVHGAPGTYNKATGGGAGVIWKQNVKKGAPFFGASLSYVAQNANSAATSAAGGIMNNNSQSNVTAQIGYQANQWKTTLAWRYGTCGTSATAGTQAASGTEACPGAVAVSGSQPNAGWNGNSVDINNFAYTLAWTPKQNGTIVPSISAGWGYSAYNQTGMLTPATITTFTSGVANQLVVNNIAATQSWQLALQWKDAFAKGNSAGMAVGQPNFVTALRNGATAQDGNYVWEWWYKFQVTDNISVSPA
ncbi:MAG: iron uptake porin, partial [Cyanobium sp. LacPavin_0920_WC12_MAG_62_9]|nr:iron uptake porin [Cyanobium sp. LacPavin_0920_WC12_MAG_62_9]